MRIRDLESACTARLLPRAQALLFRLKFLVKLFVKSLRGLGRSPTCFIVKKSQEGEEKQFGGLFFRGETPERGFPDAAQKGGIRAFNIGQIAAWGLRSRPGGAWIRAVRRAAVFSGGGP